MIPNWFKILQNTSKFHCFSQFPYFQRKLLLIFQFWTPKHFCATHNNMSLCCHFRILEGYCLKTSIKFWKVIEFLNKIETPVFRQRGFHIWPKIKVQKIGLKKGAPQFVPVTIVWFKLFFVCISFQLGQQSFH